MGGRQIMSFKFPTDIKTKRERDDVLHKISEVCRGNNMDETEQKTIFDKIMESDVPTENVPYQHNDTMDEKLRKTNENLLNAIRRHNHEDIYKLLDEIKTEIKNLNLEIGKISLNVLSQTGTLFDLGAEIRECKNAIACVEKNNTSLETPEVIPEANNMESWVSWGLLYSRLRSKFKIRCDVKDYLINNGYLKLYESYQGGSNYLITDLSNGIIKSKNGGLVCNVSNLMFNQSFVSNELEAYFEGLRNYVIGYSNGKSNNFLLNDEVPKEVTQTVPTISEDSNKIKAVDKKPGRHIGSNPETIKNAHELGLVMRKHIFNGCSVKEAMKKAGITKGQYYHWVDSGFIEKDGTPVLVIVNK